MFVLNFGVLRYSSSTKGGPRLEAVITTQLGTDGQHPTEPILAQALLFELSELVLHFSYLVPKLFNVANCPSIYGRCQQVYLSRSSPIWMSTVALVYMAGDQKVNTAWFG